MLRGACPEHYEILRYAQNDMVRRAQNDMERRAQNDMEKCQTFHYFRAPGLVKGI